MTCAYKAYRLPLVTPSGSLKYKIKPYLFIAPAVILAALFWWYPSAKGFVSSFLTMSNSGKVMGFAGLKNYIMLFSDRNFLKSIWTTLRFVLLFVPLNTVLTVLAASLTRRRSKLSFIPEYLFFSPVAISLSAYSLLFREMFRGEASVVNRIFGLDSGWITDPTGAMVTLVILGVFLDFGIDYILLMCAFRSLDKNIIEAARIDGAGGWSLLFGVELPMIGKTVMVTVFLALKDALLICAPIIILTEGGPFRSTETIMFFYYVEAFKSGNRAIQNSLSSLVLVIAAFAMIIYERRGRKRQ